MKKTLIALSIICGIVSAADENPLTKIADFSTLIKDDTSEVGTIKATSGYDQIVYTLAEGAWVGLTDQAVVDAMTASSGVVTVSAWVSMPANADTYNTIFGWGAENTGIKFGIKDDDLFLATKAVKETVSNRTIPDNQWTLISLSYNLADKQFAMFVGSDRSGHSDNFNPNDVTVEKFSIGSANGDKTSGSENFTGSIAGLKIFTSDDWVAGNYIVAAMGSAPQSIPEPTTATLSLLALAGLAARRRRK